MAWFKVDDQAAFNPKVMRAGNAAFGAWVRMGAYCNAQRTDGFVPQDTAVLIASKKDIDAAITAGMLYAVEGGYQIHDYLKYQPSKADIEASLAAARGRMRSRRSGEVRTNTDRTSGEVPPKFGVGSQNVLVRLGNGESSGSGSVSDPDPMRARVMTAWRTHTGNLISNPADGAEMVDLVLAAVADDARYMPEAYVIAFVEWVRSCEQGRRPQLAPHKFVQHFAAVQEWVRGERGPAKTGAASKSGWREPMAHQAETKDETDDL